jgi:hypothetical protein
VLPPPLPWLLLSLRMLVPVLQLSEADNIKVAVRVRPLFPHETEKGGSTVVQVNSNTTIKVRAGRRREPTSGGSLKRRLGWGGQSAAGGVAPTSATHVQHVRCRAVGSRAAHVEAMGAQRAAVARPTQTWGIAV